MKAIFGEHSRAFWTPERRRSLYLGLLLLLLSIIVQITLGRYSSHRAVGANYAGDIFLDNLPVIDLTPLIVAGDIAMWVFAWFLLIRHPRRLVFGMKAIALFIIGHSFFITLTHLGPYPHQFSPSSTNFGFGLYQIFTFQGNYFFSGHTGFSFLIALLFWDDELLKNFFLAMTVFFGATMLLAHVHYSIDVFAAPFIVYGLYVIASKVFPRDYALTAPA